MNYIELDFFNKEKIRFDRVIGVGGYGVLYLVYSEQYNTYFALKKIPEKRFNRAEEQCLIYIDNPYVVSLYKTYSSNGFIYLLLEYCPNDLEKLLHESILKSDEIVKYAHQMICGIKACHDRNIVHGDIKPSNFLIDKYGRLKVCDFGLSTFFKESNVTQHLKGTLSFIAPEILNGEEANPLKSDIWSLGITLYYMITHRYPYEGIKKEDLINQINNRKFNAKHIKDPLLAEIIMRCLQKDSNKRADISELNELIQQDPHLQKKPRSTRASLCSRKTKLTRPVIDLTC